MATLPGRIQGPDGQFRTPCEVGNHTRTWRGVACWWVEWGYVCRRGGVQWMMFLETVGPDVLEWQAVVRYWLLAAGCWLLAAGCWLLAVGCWLLVAGCWLLDVG